MPVGSVVQDLTQVLPATPWGRRCFSAGETEAWKREATNPRLPSKQMADWGFEPWCVGLQGLCHGASLQP